MLKYSIKHYFCIHSILHKSLLRALQRRGLYPLKQFQQEALRVIEMGQNVFINSCTGSGKTLSYLVPVMNNLLQKKDRNDLQPKKGALILTLNKQLVNQIYRQAKHLDAQNRLQIFRTGSFSQIKQVKKNDESDPALQTQGRMVQTILWNKLDILISTPQSLVNYMTIFKGNQGNYINPQFLVVDEADLLLQLDKNVSKNTEKLIKHIRDHSTLSSNIKYLLTASSFPNKYKGQDAIPKLESTFKTLVCIEGISKHRLPQKLQLYYIEMQEAGQKLQEQKKYFITRILTDRKDKRIIIFCKQKADIQMLNEFINNQLKSSASVLYAELRTEERAAAIASFSTGKSKILISSELGSRGLDFELPVDCIVEYDMAQNVIHFINRAGRTARNDLYGQMITFVQPKNKEFFEHLKQLKVENEQFDEMFSRKRSYSKLYKNDSESD